MHQPASSSFWIPKAPQEKYSVILISRGDTVISSSNAESYCARTNSKGYTRRAVTVRPPTVEIGSWHCGMLAQYAKSHVCCAGSCKYDSLSPRNPCVAGK
eukprot:1839371-Rhodomonas_salina.1